jgi:signal recognition particle GTPase
MNFDSMFQKMEEKYSEEELFVKIVQVEEVKGYFYPREFVKENIESLIQIDFPFETLEDLIEKFEYKFKRHEVAWNETVLQAKRHFKKNFKKGIVCMIMPTKKLKKEIFDKGIETIPYDYFFIGIK